MKAPEEGRNKTKLMISGPDFRKNHKSSGMVL
jgi:hypothetical protein